MNFSSYSTTGHVRKTNQDSHGFYQKNNHEFMAIVCDGVGGYLGGEVAAQTTSEFLIKKYIIAPSFSGQSSDLVKKWFYEQIKKLRAFFGECIKKDAKLTNMATTIVVSIGYDDKILIASMGDSRAYLLSKNKFCQITNDHNLANKKDFSSTTFQGSINQQLYQNVLYKVFGYEPSYEFDWFEIPLLSQTKLVLISDGVYNELSDQEIATIINEARDIHQAASLVCQKVNSCGGRDNSTILIGDF